MATNTETNEKRIVDQLNFGAKTAKRVGWEAWEFTIVGPYQVQVTNASYGCEKDEHQYTIVIEERAGVIVPAECECPADQYNEGYDCKHKVALATCGGTTVLEAAREFSSNPDSEQEVRTDGGVSQQEATTDECDCEGLPGDFPCWPCVRDGRRELPSNRGEAE